MKSAYKVNIVGGGFVGLTLAEVLSNQSSVSSVTVIDTDECKVDRLKEGDIPVKEKDLTLKSKKIKYTTDIKDSEGDIYFVCVGTPDSGTGFQRLEALSNAIKSVINHNVRSTIILKSTTTPENIELVESLVDPILTKLIVNPEFLAEGKAVEDLRNQPQLIVGASERDSKYAEELMSKLFNGTYDKLALVSTKEAMMIKYFLNTYKAMKLTFINSTNKYCERSGMSFKKIMDSINDPVLGTGFDKPGVGFGGSCFPKDTHALGQHMFLARCTYLINESLIKSFAESLAESVPEGSMLFIGKSFKVGTNDTRESVSVKVYDCIKNKDPERRIYFYDEDPTLSDLTEDEVLMHKSDFSAIVMFNEYTELAKKLEGMETFINTRKVL